MKRTLNILLAMMLSLMVVYLSVGTTIMHCLRTNEVKVMLAESSCQMKKCCKCCEHHDKKKQDGNLVDNGCMSYQHVQLSPTLSVQKADFCNAPSFAGIVPSMWLSLPYPIVSTFVRTIYNKVEVPHAPPRAYLALIRILII